MTVTEYCIILFPTGYCHHITELNCTDVATGIDYPQGAQIINNCRKWYVNIYNLVKQIRLDVLLL